VHVDRCVVEIGVLEVPVILRAVSCSQDSIRVRCRQVIRGILDYLNGATARAEVDTWPQLHRGWCHVTETAGVVRLVRRAEGCYSKSCGLCGISRVVTAIHRRLGDGYCKSPCSRNLDDRCCYDTEKSYDLC
jgi:hypothetical protein